MSTPSELTREVTCGEPAVFLHLKWGLHLGADLLGDWAAGMKTARARRVHRGRDLALEQDRPSRRFEIGIGHRHRALEHLRIRTQGFVAYRVARPRLDALSEIHHGDAIAHMCVHPP